MTTNTQLAVDFALNNGLNIVSDLFGNFFVVQQEGQEAFKIGRCNQGRRVLLGSTTFPNLGVATAEAKKRAGTDQPTDKIASLPDEAVIEAYCKAHGMKASDNVHAGYVTLSRPVEDRRRDWRVYKRVGTTLKALDAQSLTDRWAANAKVRQMGGPMPTTLLGGPFVHPFGGNFSRPKPLQARQDGEAA